MSAGTFEDRQRVFVVADGAGAHGLPDVVDPDAVHGPPVAEVGALPDEARDADAIVIAGRGQVRRLFAADARERELERRLLAARHLEVLGRLVGGVAHDFNNILSVVTTLSELLIQFGAADDPNREDLEEIHQAAVRGSDLTRQLLAFLRVDVGEPEPVDVNARVRSAEKLIRKLLPEDVTLGLDLAEGVPPTWADPIEIDQLILNLAAYGRSELLGGGTLELRTLGAPGGGARLEVRPVARRSEGRPAASSGQAPEVSRGSPAATGGPAMGGSVSVGLDVVREILERRGGTLQALSADAGPGVGVDLPAGAAQPAAASASPDVPAGARVLVVEDAREVRHGTCRTLVALGLQAVGVADARSAIEHVGRHGSPDLVLCDAVLADGWGSGLERDLVAAGHTPPFLFVSGHADHPALGEIRARGGALVRKPLTREALAVAVAGVLSGGGGA